MFSLELECRAKHKDLLIAELWEQGCCGVVELDANHIRAFFDDQAGADRLRKQFRAFGARLRVEEDRDWVEFSREKWEPLPVGSRFYLVPEWRDDPAPEGRFRITVNPGLAFGTGIHETTRLCLEALEEHVQPDMAVVDVGTGSGILALAAGHLRAAAIYACDVDPVAVEVAARNTEVSPVPVRFFVGSVGAMAAGSADLVVANISPEVTMELAADLLRILRPGSLALVSGFERNEIADIQAAMTKAGAEIEGTRFKGSWALVATRKSFRRG
ncbi:MAG TPA: 50S ribosomal protein L11 methyltransferase [Bryobacteraceae bacterium]|nr:50S ribosomal protein L11 methyltransferase [Bryobacteraceae bacterium]